LAVGLSFAQYPWAAHYRYAAPDLDTTERFVAPWTFLMLVSAWERICARPPDYTSRHQDIAIGQVRKFIAQNYGSTDFNFKAVFPAGGLDLSELKVEPGAAGAKAGSVNLKRSGESLGASLLRINEWMEKKLEVIQPLLQETYVLFDELDLGFEADKEDHRDRTIGLLLAMRGFIARVTRKGIPIHPVVFIRSDIFDLLRFADKNKIVNAEAIELEWHDDLRHTGASLKHLLDWRIKETLAVPSVEDAWNYAFDPQVTRGTQHKFQHMTFRTFKRPRDIIQFANSALKVAQERCVASPTPGEDARISNEDIKKARTPYSTYFYRELDDEIQTVEPTWTRYIDVVREVGAAKFTLAAYSEAHEKLSAKAAINRTPEDCLEFLYQYSVIGFERAVTKAGIIQQFRYLDEAVSFDSTAPSFQTHRALKEWLGITET